MSLFYTINENKLKSIFNILHFIYYTFNSTVEPQPLLWKSYGTCFSVIEREFCDHSTRQISCLALEKREREKFQASLKNTWEVHSKKRAPTRKKKELTM